MNTKEKLKEEINRLIELTKSDKIEWHGGRQSNTFQYKSDSINTRIIIELMLKIFPQHEKENDYRFMIVQNNRPVCSIDTIGESDNMELLSLLYTEAKKNKHRNDIKNDDTENKEGLKLLGKILGEIK